MSISREFVSELFDNLQSGRQDVFFEHVADDVTWHVMGTHPLAGIYRSKSDFKTHTFERLNKILKGGVILKVHNIFVDGDTAIVEMSQLSTAINDKPFHNCYCWIVYFKNESIVTVRAYLDSALVHQLIVDNVTI